MAPEEIELSTLRSAGLPVVNSVLARLDFHELLRSYLPPRARLSLWDPAGPGDRRARTQLGARAPSPLRPLVMSGPFLAWVARPRRRRTQDAQRRLCQTGPRRAAPNRAGELAHELESLGDQRARRAPRRLDLDPPLRRLLLSRCTNFEAPNTPRGGVTSTPPCAGLLQESPPGPVATRVGVHDLG